MIYSARDNPDEKFDLSPCRNLMAKQDMSELGFGKGLESDSPEKSNAEIDEQTKPSSPSKTILG